MSTINPEEINKFSQMAEEWWSATGKFKPLHQFNPCRINYIKEQIIAHFALEASSSQPLKGLKILDVGCGGGLLCEPLTRLGAQVVGIDAGEKNIKIAQLHSKQSGLEIDYRNQDVENLAKSEEKFDVVLAMEVVEHVADVENFLAACANCLKKGENNSQDNLENNLKDIQEINSKKDQQNQNLTDNLTKKTPKNLIFIATLNRTFKSYAKAIIGAEYILGWLPKGTHNWQKFLKPSEINQIAQAKNLKLLNLTGFSYNLLKNQWKQSQDISTNYALIFTNNNV